MITALLVRTALFTNQPNGSSLVDMQNVITDVACGAIIQKGVEIQTREMYKKESDMEKVSSNYL